jgi:hypothetical protein
MNLEHWLIYLAAAIGLSLTPGPNGLLSLTNGAYFGFRPPVYTVLGGPSSGVSRRQGRPARGVGKGLCGRQVPDLEAQITPRWRSVSMRSDEKPHLLKTRSVSSPSAGAGLLGNSSPAHA